MNGYKLTHNAPAGQGIDDKQLTARGAAAEWNSGSTADLETKQAPARYGQRTRVI
jgi:hypothetical protein